MITDDDMSIRNDAFKKILRARSAGGEEMRCFEKPKDAINFECTRYQDMVDWEKVNITEPPILQFYTNEYLKGFIDSKEIIDIPGNRKLKSLCLLVCTIFSFFPLFLFIISLHHLSLSRIPMSHTKHRATN